jgi:hypothetical protein
LVRPKCGNETFKLTRVYGPTDYSLKIDFFRELLDLKPALGTKWLALGDFNQIHHACDKNNLNIDRGRLTRFRDTLNACDLKDIHLQNRKFTWSNEQDSPTMSRIDAFFSNEAWDLTHDDHVLHALSSSLSDHCPLLLASCHGPKKPHSFRFEEFWVDIPGFFDVVNKAWAEPTFHSEPYHILHTKLTLTGKLNMVWSKGLFSNAKIQLHMALQVIYHLDLAMESRQLSPEERDIRARLKRRVIGLASLERSRKKQRARINNLRHGDANTKFFHRKVNCRRRKNFILKLRHNNGWVTTHDEKQRVAQSHFTAAIGRVNPRPISFNWDMLNLPSPNLEGLDEFTFFGSDVFDYCRRCSKCVSVWFCNFTYRIFAGGAELHRVNYGALRGYQDLTSNLTFGCWAHEPKTLHLEAI